MALVSVDIFILYLYFPFIFFFKGLNTSQMFTEWSGSKTSTIQLTFLIGFSYFAGEPLL